MRSESRVCRDCDGFGIQVRLPDCCGGREKRENEYLAVYTGEGSGPNDTVDVGPLKED